MKKFALAASILVTLFAVTSCKENRDNVPNNPNQPPRTVPQNPNQPPPPPADQR